jgi:hypothetical protein
MRIKPLKVLCLIFFTAQSAIIPAGAATISIMIIGTGATDGAVAKGTADLWESGMMDVFFEGGHIVCNSPAVRIAVPGGGELPEEARRNFADADAGGVDFFVIAQLNYPQNESSGPTGPDKVSLSLYRVRPYCVLYKTSYPLNPGLPAEERISGAKDAARRLSRYIGGA